MRAAYGDPNVRGIAGSIQLLGGPTAPADWTAADIAGGVRVAGTVGAVVLELTLRTDAPYALLGAQVNRAAPYVILGNELAMRSDDASDPAAPLVADLDTMVFREPLSVIDAFLLKLVLVQP